MIVRVEGETRTLLPPTEVTTNTSPVVKDGNPAHSCTGTSAAGALELATSGNWSGTWFEHLGYSVEAILSESHLFSSGSYWDIWTNHEESEGLCAKPEMQPGEELLLFPCTSALPECPSPLAIEAPKSANVGEVGVTVTKYGIHGESTPLAGATVTDATKTTDAGGHTTVLFARPGQYALQATAPGFVRDETTICVHEGSDGTCGIKGPGTSGSSSGGGVGGSGGVLGFSSTPYKGPFAVVADVTGLIDGHRYSRRHAPRVLAGKVLSHTAVTSLSLRLRRTYRGRCYAYSGSRERFASAHCRQGSFFKVPAESSFSYLLPESLPPGRYVLDVEATDAAGNRTTLLRGTSRIVFYVA